MVAITLGVSLATEIDPLAPLPRFDAEEKESRLNEDDAPFPGDTSMLEDNVVEARNIQEWEDGDETSHDGPEQELVAPDVVHPLGEVFLGPGLHAEEAAAHINHLPGEEEGEPGQTDKGCRTGSENGLTLRLVIVVAMSLKISVSEAEHHKREGC